MRKFAGLLASLTCYCLLLSACEPIGTSSSSSQNPVQPESLSIQLAPMLPGTKWSYLGLHMVTYGIPTMPIDGSHDSISREISVLSERVEAGNRCYVIASRDSLFDRYPVISGPIPVLDSAHPLSATSIGYTDTLCLLPNGSVNIRGDGIQAPSGNDLNLDLPDFLLQKVKIENDTSSRILVLDSLRFSADIWAGFLGVGGLITDHDLKYLEGIGLIRFEWNERHSMTPGGGGSVDFRLVGFNGKPILIPDLDMVGIPRRDFFPFAVGNAWRYSITRTINSAASGPTEILGRDSGTYSISILRQTDDSVTIRYSEWLARAFLGADWQRDTLKTDTVFTVVRAPDSIPSAIARICMTRKFAVEEPYFPYSGAVNWYAAPPESVTAGQVKPGSYLGRPVKAVSCRVKDRNPNRDSISADPYGTARFAKGIGLLTFSGTYWKMSSSVNESDSLLEFPAYR